MNHKHAWALVTALVLTSGCTNEPSTSKSAADLAISTSQPSPTKEHYEEVRERLISDGWKPVPAKCSTQNLCGEHLELSTDMRTVISCGVFKKDKQTATVCGESIPDALIVTSIEIDPPSE